MSDIAKTPKAFVIGPIGDRDAADGTPARKAYEEAIQILEEVVVPACTALGVAAIRADNITRTGEIPEQIFRHLRDAEIVIADLTSANPNVMYELGLRHTTGKLTFQIGERERLPFDVATIRTIMFKRTDGGLVEARRRLVQALANGLESGGDPVAATRVWFEQSPVAAIPIEAECENEEPAPDEPGFLEKLADTEDAMQSLVRALTTATTISEEITQVFTEATARVSNLNEGYGTSAAKLALANRVAILLEDPAVRLQVTAGEYAQSVQRMEPGISYLLTRLIEEPDQIAQAPDFLDQMQTLIDAAEGSIQGTLAFKEMIEGLGGAARSLKQVGNKISGSLRSIANSSTRVVSWRTLIERCHMLEKEPLTIPPRSYP